MYYCIGEEAENELDRALAVEELELDEDDQGYDYDEEWPEEEEG
jgi:hypothetical protein